MNSLIARPAWQADAACIRPGVDPEWFFAPKGDHASMAKALAVCAACPVREECLQFALEHSEIIGVWGGTSAKQRRTMRRELGMTTKRGPDPLPCGTRAAALRHRKMHEPVCDECREAERIYNHARRGSVAA